ncbi:MAG: hypothetical protein IJJ00_06645 [Erysipelotrichaceae bacterium]|nr:hypothetical protein [Erysipelotrichaceae bacterium]
MLNKVRRYLYRYFLERNGVDSLGKALLWIVCIVFIITMLLKGIAKIVFVLILWALIMYMYFRIFSKNLPKRRAENARYEGKIRYFKTRMKQGKDYRFYNCPSCGTHLRVPKGAGKITITCSKCGHKFDRKA